MKPREIIFAIIAGVVLLIVCGAMWIWITIPPELDPQTLPANALVQPPDGYQSAVDEARTVARSLAAEETLPGLSLAVAVDGMIVWAEAFGWSDEDSQAAMMATALFR